MSTKSLRPVTGFWAQAESTPTAASAVMSFLIVSMVGILTGAAESSKTASDCMWTGAFQ